MFYRYYKEYRLTLLMITFSSTAVYCCEQIIQDAHALFDIIIQNHPGIHNKEDLTFKQKFENEFQEIVYSLNNAQTYTEGFAILQEWIRSFDDPHLRLANVTQQNINQSNNDNIHWCWWTKDTFYMKIATFTFNKKEQAELKNLLKILPDIQKAKNIVFDVRGNGGGSSLWAKKITSSLFGSQYVQQKNIFL